MFEFTERKQRRRIAEYLVVAAAVAAGGAHLGVDPVIVGAACGTALGGAARHWVKLRGLRGSGGAHHGA